MKIRMLKTENGSVDGIRVKSFEEGKEYDLTRTAGERDLAAAFVGAKMAVEVPVHSSASNVKAIAGTIEERPDDSADGEQIEAQGLGTIHEAVIEPAAETKRGKRKG